MKRLAYGSTKYMTTEQIKAHKRMLSKRWRDNNPDCVKAMNHKWALYYSHNKPFICVCKKCNKSFNGIRKYIKVCPDCVKAKHENYHKMMEIKLNKRIEKQKIKKYIIDLYNKGYLQREIGQLVGKSQSCVSYIIRTYKE